MEFTINQTKTFEEQFMKKLGSTEAKLKKALLIKKTYIKN